MNKKDVLERILGQTDLVFRMFDSYLTVVQTYLEMGKSKEMALPFLDKVASIIETETVIKQFFNNALREEYRKVTSSKKDESIF